MRPYHYEIESGLIKKLIKDRQDFFLGGRGIGATFTTTAVGWKVEMERARLVLYADEIEVKDGKLVLSVEGGYSEFGELDLAHYLKVTVIW